MKVEPGLVSVKDLLLKAHSGDRSVWLPSFQRRFVWDPVNIKAFFDSLLKGNPVGILLLWRTKNPESSDPFVLRVLVGEGKSSENYLIADGQQRVLSLLLLLNVWHVKVGDMKYSREQISFNPTRYVLKVGKRGLDLSEGMRAPSRPQGCGHSEEEVCERVRRKTPRPLRVNSILQDSCLLHGPRRREEPLGEGRRDLRPRQQGTLLRTVQGL